jgi:hypothetical protein
MVITQMSYFLARSQMQLNIRQARNPRKRGINASDRTIGCGFGIRTVSADSILTSLLP